MFVCPLGVDGYDRWFCFGFYLDGFIVYIFEVLYGVGELLWEHIVHWFCGGV